MWTYRKSAIVVLFLFCCWGGARLYFTLTDGFSMGQITPQSYQLQETLYKAHYSADEMAAISRLLDQPYRYLARGAQSYAFLSKDGQYVLKIFKQKHLSLSFIEEWIYALPGMGSFKEKRIAKHKQRWDKILSSTSLAHEKLKEDTRLVYFHFLPTIGVLPEIVLYDKLGFSHHVELDHYLFYVQKYVVTLNIALSTWDEAKVKVALSRLIDKLLERSRKGVQELDYKVLENIGFIGTEPVFLDIGSFVVRDDLHEPSVYISVLHQDLAPLIKFLKIHHPSLAVWLESELQKISI